MIDRDWLGERPIQFALAALAFALVFGAWELTRAVRLDPVAEGTPLRIKSAEALAKSVARNPSDVVAVVAMNVFSEERTAPKRRYRLAGYTEVKAPDLPKPIVFGTVVSGGNDRSFALCWVSGGQTVVVRVGSILGGYTVKSIERGLVVFATPTGERLAIAAQK